MTNEQPLPFVGTTKKELFDVYIEKFNELQELKGLTTSTGLINEKAHETAVLSAAGTVMETASGTLNQLKDSLVDTLSKVSDDFTKKIEEYHTISEALSIAQAQLKDVYDVTATADSLSAMIAAQVQITKKYKEENEAATQQILKLNEEKEKRSKEIDAEIALEHKRKLAEMEYEHSRKSQELADELAYATKQHEASLEDSNKELLERIASVERREDKMTELEDKVAGIDKLVSDEVSKACAITKATLTKEFESHKREINSNAEANIRIAESRTKMLEEALESAKAQIEELNKKIERAYESVETVAKASVDGARTEQAVKSVLGTVDTGSKR